MPEQEEEPVTLDVHSSRITQPATQPATEPEPEEDDDGEVRS